MSRFSIAHPHFVFVACLMAAIFGLTALVRMPVDMFPPINIPVVVVATFYSGMPPEQIETDITGRFERFFTLGSGIEHIESRSLTGVSLIKIFFQPGSSADAAVTMISNLAMANLRRLPPGTLPPVVLKFDASSLPVCLVTLKGEGLSETSLRDTGQYGVRNQIASVPGASVPPPFGGRYRQIMIYVDPLKLEAHQLSPMDVVRAVNQSNLILPAGDVKLGDLDYTIYTNSQIDSVADIGKIPLKNEGAATVTVDSIGAAKDAQAIQTNVVRVDGQKSVYLPILKQGGDTNTIAVVDGIKAALAKLVDVPRQLSTRVVFDQSVFVKNAIETLLHEGAIGLVLTSLMVLMFLGNMRATVAVFLSIPLSCLVTFMVLGMGGGSVNSMVLGGLALAFSRLIDNSVVVLENIFRHLELGEKPDVAAAKGGEEMALPVLAATLCTAIVFFPVTFLYGVSKFLFTALALAVVISLFASYFVALTVVPLFCAKLIKGHGDHGGHGLAARLFALFERSFALLLRVYGAFLRLGLRFPVTLLLATLGLFAGSLTLGADLGVTLFPRTDAGQFVINLKAASGTRLEVTELEVAKVEALIREVVDPADLAMIVSNVGVSPDFSAIYTSNAASHTAFVQVSLVEGHRKPSDEYMNAVRERMRVKLPGLTTYFQSGGLVDAVLNMGLPAPIDLQISGGNLENDYAVASDVARRIRHVPGVSDVYIPQDLDYPTLKLEVDRVRSGQLGLSQREVVQNVITALTSNQMIAPSYWVDPKSGNDYLLTVQLPEQQVQSQFDLKRIPLHGSSAGATSLDAVSRLERATSPTEVDHYQIQRVIDVYVGTAGEDLGRVASEIEKILADTKLPPGVRVSFRGMVEGMRASFRSFGLGLVLAVMLVYLILVAQFASFRDPVLILLSVPLGLIGVLWVLSETGTTLNVQSLMGVVMMVGIVVSNSILIVEFTARLRAEGQPLREAVETACRVRLRPILMTSLATIFGLMPMAMKLGTGSEAYAPLARAIIGGLGSSVILTVFVVPAAYLLAHREKNDHV